MPCHKEEAHREMYTPRCFRGAAAIVGLAMGVAVLSGGPARAIDYELSPERLAELIRQARAMSEEDLRREYRIPAFDLGGESATVLMNTKSYDVMRRAQADPAFGVAQCEPVLARTTFDVVLTVESGDPPHPPDYYAIHIYQYGKIILPVAREEREVDGKVVIRARFREAVLDGHGDGVLQLYPGGVRGHAPGARSFLIDFSKLR